MNPSPTIKFRIIQQSHRLLLLPIVLVVANPIESYAQIIPDATLPSNSSVNAIGSTTTINGGTTVGGNLFHSFQQFSLPSGTAFFNNSTAIQNIITRVTGSSSSNINGILQTNGSANLFFINPNGITFGSDARLNIGGSFIASTAQSLKFADGNSFNAVAPQTSLLTVSLPIGLQYGSSTPAPISVQGIGNNVTFDPFTLETLPNTNPGLQVSPGQTLALVGGDIKLDGGNLLAPDGRIELGAVRGGVVDLTATNSGLTLGYGNVNSFGDINLGNKASVDVSGNGGGSIQIQSRVLSMANASTVLALTQGNVAGQGITIRATDAIEVSSTGVTADAVNSGRSYISLIATDTGSASSARGGDLTIETKSLRVLDGSQLSANSNGSERGGNFNVTAQTVELVGGILGLGVNSGLYTNVNLGNGQGGNLNLFTNTLQVLNGGQISANTFDSGNAGSINVNAQSVVIDGFGGDNASSNISSLSALGPGNSGRVEINSDRLQVLNGGRIDTTTFTAGSAGDLVINAKDLQVIGVGPDGRSSRILANVDRGATGNGGNLILNSDRILVSDGGGIATLTYGVGNAGNLMVNAQTIQVLGTSPVGRPSALLASAELNSIGKGGNLKITTNDLEVVNGAQIITSTRGLGDSGILTINANTIDLNGVGRNTRSGLFGNALDSTGAGGDVQVTANQLNIRNGATINVGNFPSLDPSITPGQGPAGNAQLNVKQINLDYSTITANSVTGSGGNLLFSSDAIVLRRGSVISTNAQGTATGGNIDVKTNFLIAVPRENSDITANAIQGRGGNVDILTQGLFGLKFRDRLTPESDITASSEFGLNGMVQINSLGLDPSSGLVKLMTDMIDPSRLISKGCAGNVGNRFIITGRGGLPTNPTDLKRSPRAWGDVRSPIAQSTSIGIPIVQTQAPKSQIIEASMIQTNSDGSIELVDGSPVGSMNAASCSGLRTTQ